MRTLVLVLCGSFFVPVMVRGQAAGSPGEGLKAEPGTNPGTVATSWWGKPGRT